MSGMSPEQVRRLFAQEAEVRLAELGRLLLQLEENTDNGTVVGSVFRELHTLKGSAAVAGLDEVSRMAHHLEELVEEVRAGQRAVTAEVIDALWQGTDQLRAAVSGSQVERAGTGIGPPLARGPGSGTRRRATRSPADHHHGRSRLHHGSGRTPGGARPPRR